MRAGLFPGQGIRPREILDALDGHHRYLDAADEVLAYPLRRRVETVARTPRGKLSTMVAQPVIFVAGCIAWEASQRDGLEVDALAGHSLGEYTALVAGGAMSFEAALRVVAARADAMHAASRTTEGGMAAVMGLDASQVEEIAEGAGVTIANDNAPGQMVVAGPEPALARASSAAVASGGRAVLLDVSGPFHTDAMLPAADAVRDALEQTDVRTPAIPVVSNVTARPYRAPGEIRKMLVEQVTRRVRFRESLEWLVAQGFHDFHDFGPGRVVGRLAEQTKKEVLVRA